MQVRYVSPFSVKGLFIFPCQHPKTRVSQRIGVDITAAGRIRFCFRLDDACMTSIITSFPPCDLPKSCSSQKQLSSEAGPQAKRFHLCIGSVLLALRLRDRRFNLDVRLPAPPPARAARTGRLVS
jgi:hypothetical protein